MMARTRPTRLPAIAAAMLAASASRCVASSAAAFAAAHHLPPRLHRGRHRCRHLRVRTVSATPTRTTTADDCGGIRDDDDDDDLDSTRGNDDGEDDHRDYKAFVDDVISFLDGDGVTHRPMSREELRRVLERHFSFDDDDGGGGGGVSGAVVVESRSKERRRGGVVDETLALLGREVFLVVGDDAASAPASTGEEGARRHSFALHLCPIPDLEAMRTSHRRHLRRRRHYPDDHEEEDDDGGNDYDEEDDDSTTTSRAVAAHAWLSARVTDAFSSFRRRGGDDDDDGRTPTSVVHLHRDVWERSRSIVMSRLRGKYGMHRRRYYARRTDARRIDKSEYAPFLAEHHLWGAIGAKYAYGLFARDRRRDDDDDGGRTMPGPGDIVAAATFSSGRTINRSGCAFRSFELLRFCTAKDATVVGGLTKLISAFAKDVGRRGNGDEYDRATTGMDIVTSIDRDFGCGDAWPNFASVDVMDPVPMFVGDVDGARRHAVGVGLTPLEQPRRRRRSGDDGDRSTKRLSETIASSGVRRAGLPDSLLQELGEGGGGALGINGGYDRNDRRDDPWRIAARRGFHPVFDAGVERLMSVVVYGGGGIVFVDGGDDDGTKSGPSPVELWDASTPRYAKEHYSTNSGVRDMLGCIRSSRLKK